MTTPEASILNALNARMKALVLNPVLAVSYLKKDFTPGEDSYLAVTHFPNTTDMATIGVGGLNRHTGIYQIMLNASKLQDAAVDAEIAGQIIQWFKVGTAMVWGDVTVRVERPPSIGSMLAGALKDETPISIRYFADAVRS